MGPIPKGELQNTLGVVVGIYIAIMATFVQNWPFIFAANLALIGYILVFNLVILVRTRLLFEKVSNILEIRSRTIKLCGSKIKPEISNLNISNIKIIPKNVPISYKPVQIRHLSTGKYEIESGEIQDHKIVLRYTLSDTPTINFLILFGSPIIVFLTLMDEIRDYYYQLNHTLDYLNRVTDNILSDNIIEFNLHKKRIDERNIMSKNIKKYSAEVFKNIYKETGGKNELSIL